MEILCTILYFPLKTTISPLKLLNLPFREATAFNLFFTSLLCKEVPLCQILNLPRNTGNTNKIVLGIFFKLQLSCMMCFSLPKGRNAEKNSSWLKDILGKNLTCVYYLQQTLTVGQFTVELYLTHCKPLENYSFRTPVLLSKTNVQMWKETNDISFMSSISLINFVNACYKFTLHSNP